MGLHYNILTDDPTMENYLALYISIKGYTDKKTGKKVFPTAKESCQFMKIPVTEQEYLVKYNREEGKNNE